MPNTRKERLTAPVASAFARVLRLLIEEVGAQKVADLTPYKDKSLYGRVGKEDFPVPWARSVAQSILDRTEDPPGLKKHEARTLARSDTALRLLFDRTDGFRRCDLWTEGPDWLDRLTPDEVEPRTRANGHAGRAEASPDIPRAVEARVGLAALSASYDLRNSPADGRTLLVTLNTFIERFEDDETGAVYPVQLESAVLDLVWKGSIRDPLAWKSASVETVGDRNVTVEFIGAPPKAARWRLSNLHVWPTGGQFEREYFGVITGDSDPDDALSLKIGLTDLKVGTEAQEQELEQKSVQKRRVWTQLLRKAALGQLESEIVISRQALPWSHD